MQQKVFRLISILDDPVVMKLIYLDRLVRFYAKFLSTWKTAGVTSDGKEVRVKFMTINKYGYENFTERIFPMDDIDLRISAYKEKIAVEFAKRHDNPRIQRAKEVHKWKKYIEDAKIQM
jgi:hypothetical protein